LITEMRLRRNLANKAGDAPICEIADPPHTIFPDQPLKDAVLEMNKHRVRQLIVVESEQNPRMIGVITMSDIVRAQAAVLAGN
jgi:CBS domain-containing protein